MSRNRFELLLAMWHFSNNDESPAGDRLCKLSSLISILVLVIKRYIPYKAHKYGVKAFKLCCAKGYTWNVMMYAGQEKYGRQSVPINVVLKLANDLLGADRIIVTDNYYTSLELAITLRDHQTHLIGTLRKNRKGIRKEVVDKKKLKRGKNYVLKWKDKREVLMLSTKHSQESVPVQRKTGVVTKPKIILDYSEGEGHIDLSEQITFYVYSLKKTLRCHKNIAIELFFGTSLAITKTKFKEAVVMELLKKLQDTVEEGEPIATRPKKIISSYTTAERWR
ncbi:hypothetical protein PR048_001518 [Dryococelus australis]|uniref:PiggyBac transposable element-derived protein domain-containing protein n=1 Tax=Dryococelus australis TaxID=614101 RepID=A0ABQ9IHL0_9NEOP|nr:hypothetical protein PR048_001518 [Dryococelus australis]